jgi:hypothetical protein
MMNMIELQDKLKNFSQDQLVSMMQQPTGEAPQFMVLSEITRRQKMQKEAESQQAPTQSVAQEAVAAAGVPQGGIADMARSLAPQTNVAQNTGVNPAAPPQGMPMPSAPQGPAPMAAAPQGIARMASGGVIKMQAAGKVQFWPQDQMMKLAGIVNNGKSTNPDDFPERKIIATVPYGYRGEFINVYNDYTLMNVDKDGNEYDIVRDKTSANKVFDALDVPVEDRQIRTEDGKGRPELKELDFFMSPQMKIDAQKKAALAEETAAAESAPTGLGAYAAPTMDAPVSDSAPSTPVFDATVDAPIAPQMPVPPKTDSMPQGPRPSGTQVNIAGNIYAVLGDGSVIDQTGRTPPPPVAEQARRQAGTPAAQFTTQQQYQNAQNLANRIGANSGENAVLPSENLLMGGGREGTPYLNTPAADTAIYAGGYDPQSRAATSTTGLAALSQETMPTVGGPDPRGGLDIQSKINRLRAIIESNASPMERMQAAQELEKLNDSVAMTQGYLAQQKRNLPPGYIMTAMGVQLDPNYVAPGTTGNSIIDQTVTQGGSAALSTLPAGIQSMVDPALLKAAQDKANLTDFEKGVYPINQTKSTATDVLDNPFAPKDLKIEAQKVIDQAAKETEALASKTGMNPELFSPRVLNETGYSGLTEYDPTATLTPTVASVLEKSALAAELTDAMKPKPRPKDLFAPTTDNALGGGGSGTGTGSGTGSGGMSDYETELMKIMKSREKAAESDKWLALAQVGMGLMQGGSGSFLGDVGAAGMKGLETLRTSRDQADTDKLSLLKAREDARIDRARIAASAAKGTAPNATALKSVIADLDMAMAPLAAKEASGKLTNDERTQLAQLRDQRNHYSTILGNLAGGSYGAFPAQATAAGPKNLSNNPPVERGFIGKGIDAVSSFVTG